MKRLVCLIVAVCFTLPLFARGGSNYKSWGQSPQGLFMTKAERDRWATIDNDAEAQKFISDFLTKRSSEFPKMVAERAAKADQYLSVGKILGSSTLRGKIIILFGPPAAMEVATTRQEGKAQSTFEGSVSAGGDGTGMSVSDAVLAAQAGGMASGGTNIYTITYRAKALPARDKDLIVAVEVPLSGGQDRIRDKKAAAEVDDLFERVAAASIVAQSHETASR